MIRREAGSGGVSPTVYLPLAGGTMVGNVIFNDNVSVLLGTGSDGNLYHDGTNTYFKNATGNIYIENDTIDGDIIFKVNDGGVDTAVMTLDGATGNVGIGTTSPGAKLQVHDGGLLVKNTTANAGNITIDSLVAQESQLEWSKAGSPKWYAYVPASSNDLRFWDTADRVTIQSGGNVGIGTTGPGAQLDVVNPSSSSVIRAKSTAGGVAMLQLDAPNTSSYIDFNNAGVNKGEIFYYHPTNYMSFNTNGTEKVRITTDGNVGIGTTGPTNLFSLTGQSAKTIWSERNTTAATAGQNLTLRVGGAVAGGTDLGGGSLILAGGTSTGTGTSTVLLQTSPAGSTGTADNALATMLEITGNKFSVFGVTAVVRATALTAADASALNTGDATSDTVIANMRTRIGELESKLTAYGLLT